MQNRTITKSYKGILKLVVCTAAALTCGFSVPAVIAQDSQRLPQFTIQVDSFDSLVEAVEYGYELPFDEDAVAVAKFRRGTRESFVLAVGTFYTALEAQNTMDLVCKESGLNSCRVRYLGDLENINAPQPTTLVAEAAPVEVYEAPAPSVIDPADIVEQEPESAEPIVAELIEEVAPIVTEPPPVLLLPSEEEKVEPVELVSAADTANFDRSLSDLSPDFDELVYTVQIAAAYERQGLERMARKLPANEYAAEIIPTIGGRGNRIFTLTAGRFAFKDDAQAYAADACAAVGASGCWVKPLALLKPVGASDAISITDNRPSQADAVIAAPGGSELVYTVQLAALYDIASSERLASKVPAVRGRPEINPFIGGRGNLVYGVTVGRFAFKDDAKVFADEVCAEIGVRGCWVKPLAMMERERQELPSDMNAFMANMPKTREQNSKKKILVNLSDTGVRYTVQIAAVQDSAKANALAARISADDIEVVPIRSVDGGVLYSVTVGRFDDRDKGQDQATDICKQLSLSGCWVKPVALIEKARVFE